MANIKAIQISAYDMTISSAEKLALISALRFTLARTEQTAMNRSRQVELLEMLTEVF